MPKKCIFNKSDFESSDGMLTYVWGPSLWHFLHTMSFNYPVNPTCQDKKEYMRFIKSLRYILPCRYCRENLTRNLKETGFSIKDMRSRESFSKFVYRLHNHINKMLGKKNSIKFDEVRSRYENFRSRCSQTKTVPKFPIKKVILSKNNKKCLGKNNNNSNNLNNNNSNNMPIGNMPVGNMPIGNNKNVKEKGCTNPITGIKSKCIIRIVPKTCRKCTFKMDPKCKAIRLNKTKKSKK